MRAGGCGYVAEMAPASKAVKRLQYASVRERHEHGGVHLTLFFMTAPTYHHSISYDLAKVKHPLPMRGADREDAIKVFILRDGQVFIWNRPSESCRFVPEDSRSPERPQH